MAIRDVNKIYKERFAKLVKRYPEFPVSTSDKQEYRTLLQQTKVNNPPYHARYYVTSLNAVLDDLNQFAEIAMRPGIDTYFGIIASFGDLKRIKEKAEHDEAVVDRLLTSLNDIELADTEEGGSSDDSTFSVNDLSRYGHTI